jgi:hypothetical protein
LTGTEASRQLVVDDGRYKHGFVISSFRVWGAPTVEGSNVSAVLSRSATAVTTMNASNSPVFAWAATINETTNGMTEWNILDPEHVVNEELHLHNVNGTAFNYLIVMHDLMMTDEQGVLQLVKNQSQS